MHDIWNQSVCSLEGQRNKTSGIPRSLFWDVILILVNYTWTLSIYLNQPKKTVVPFCQNASLTNSPRKNKHTFVVVITGISSVCCDTPSWWSTGSCRFYTWNSLRFFSQDTNLGCHNLTATTGTTSQPMWLDRQVRVCDIVTEYTHKTKQNKTLLSFKQQKEGARRNKSCNINWRPKFLQGRFTPSVLHQIEGRWLSSFLSSLFIWSWLCVVWDKPRLLWPGKY